MEVIIVTGMSGAGKSTGLNFLEDFGYFCIDNLPLPMISHVLELYQKDDKVERIAIGIDIRGIKSNSDVEEVQKQLAELDTEAKIIFLDSKDEVLIRRYKETRRSHPLAKTISIVDAIKEERDLIMPLKDIATDIIDTSTILVRELKIELSNVLFGLKQYNNLVININTLGFKYGVPNDSDLVFDVRFMPNPYYEPELKILTGEDVSVRDYVMNSEVSQQFEKKLHDMIEFLIPQYINEGKNLLVISIGCTGGKHRSVTIASRLYDYVKSLGYTVFLKHNDIKKGWYVIY